jgi:DNA topoisomerase-2
MSKTKNFTSYGIKHYKGLGSLSKEEARAYFSQIDRHRIYFHHNGDRDDKAIIMAYDQKHISEWKYRVNFWKSGCKELSKLGYPEEIYGEGVKQVSFYDFVHKDLIRFNNLEYERSVPSVIDGFTRRHRKVLYTCIKRDDKQEVNVAVLAGSVAEHSAYPQPALLFGPIIELAQDFIGSNNLNFLLPNGQFGTRHEVFYFCMTICFLF